MSTHAVADQLGPAALAAVESGDAKRRPREYGLWIGAGFLMLVILATLIVNVGHVGSPDKLAVTNALQAPSLSHPFGTDALGRDVFVRTIAASGVDLEVGVVTTVLPLIIGMVLGMLAGFYGGWMDALIMRVMDALLAFPFIVLILAFVTVFGVGLEGIYIGLTIVSIPFFARLTRGQFLVLREQQFMLAARTLGYSNRRIIFKHALPHLIRPNLVFVPSNILGNILTVAALSFLGLGVQPPQPEWGAIIASGQQYLLTAWWISTLPGFFVVLVGIAFSLCGDGLAERLRLRIS